jgi:hypothetical protein
MDFALLCDNEAVSERILGDDTARRGLLREACAAANHTIRTAPRYSGWAAAGRFFSFTCRSIPLP